MLAEYFQEAIEWRRALHRCPQPAWLEFFATAFIAEKLSDWGYQLKLGRDIIETSRQLLLPPEEKLSAELERAAAEGANRKFLDQAAGGFTGVVATLTGTLPGPTVAFRFDIDSNEVEESTAPSHRPAAAGFLSRNPGYSHMCGHDAHAAIGLMLAKYFAEHRESVRGQVKFIFQPNEENLSGATAMLAKGVADDVDVFLGGHVGLALREIGQICFNVSGFLALSRHEITFKGRPTHAALRPDEGKNAMLGACAAVSNLYAIARHGLGASRINVGVLNAGTTWNVIPDRAYFRLETRGVTNEINQYMTEKAMEVIHGAAAMYGLEVEIVPAAVAFNAVNSPDLVATAVEQASRLTSVKQVVPTADFGASEDVTLFMEHVQSRGGRALFVLFGTPTGGGHHNAAFDIDENVILNAAEFFLKMHEAVTGG